MERRVLLAVFLSFLVLYAYQAVVPQPKPRQPAKPAATATSHGPTPAPAETGSSATVAPATSAAAAETTPSPVGNTLVGEAQARDVIVETGTLVATFTTEGARLKSWRLKRFNDDVGRPVDLVPAGLPGSLPLPFTLKTEDTKTTARLTNAIFRATGDRSGRVDATSKDATVTFEFEEAGGLKARKAFRFRPDSYIVEFTASTEADGTRLNPVVQWGPGLGDAVFVPSQKSTFSTYVQGPQAIVYRDGKVLRVASSAIAAEPTYQGPFPFAGIDDHYFLSSLVKPGLVRVQYEPVSLPIVTAKGPAARELMAWSVLFAQPPTAAQFYFGPKQFDVLAAVDRDLTRTIHYGMFAFLAVPLQRALTWINTYIGNYGWSIIALTILINLAMFPLRHKSVTSMRKLQELQPQVKAIQDRYAKLKVTDPDRQKMNQELMALYKERGVNPASGCVPMLLTMPVLFAFYALLSVAIEMRGAPFMLWITDLSKHDPLYITPVLMGVTMLWQQRLTPVTDPAQQKVMMITPIMFLVFFLWAPSGLVIYWFVSNLLGIGQQYATNWIAGKPVAKAVRPPAERRLKAAGGGTTGKTS